MQKADQISLNAVRIFATAADCGSYKRAAVRLGVTPGAVSRQVLKLEADLGVTLFRRGNNTIRLTETGEAFLRSAGAGLHTLHRSIEMAMSDGRDLSVLVPTTLATRWLIPRLEGFKKRRPDVAIRIETWGKTGLPPTHGADIALAYYPAGQSPGDGEVLLHDRCRPYLSPKLRDAAPDRADLTRIPALQSTQNNWDWQVWLRDTGNAGTKLVFGGQFDLDDVAIRAAIAGIGMVLAPRFMVSDDLADGRLCPLPDSAEALIGSYLLSTSLPMTAAGSAFVRWLKSIAQQ
ncbi:MAG: LysR substrate-binding domain-containing protein [Pseudomonadota bacterium]